jgi:hypothetical protein
VNREVLTRPFVRAAPPVLLLNLGHCAKKNALAGPPWHFSDLPMGRGYPLGERFSSMKAAKRRNR